MLSSMRRFWHASVIGAAQQDRTDFCTRQKSAASIKFVVEEKKLQHYFDLQRMLLAEIDGKSSTSI